MKPRILLICLFALVGCNSVYMKPHSLDTNKVFYADRGGYSMRRSIKEVMEERGYNVVVGRMRSTRGMSGDDEDIEIDTASVPSNARYIVKVRERREKFFPIWCVFNGFWWWNFNVSIADQTTNEEILSWRGRGCANSSLDKLNSILDKLEK